MKLNSDFPSLVDEAIKICRLAKDNGGRAFFVGGCVRDALLGKTIQDLDIEIYGIPGQRLMEIYTMHYRLNLVGKVFGVLKFSDWPIDISLPRRESKTGQGHRDFLITSDENLDFHSACSRRDFTINAILHDPLTNETIDPLSGLEDLKSRVLRHCSDKFPEDPLRVLRLMRFSASLEFDIAPETIAISSEIDLSHISRERVFSEWSRMLLEASRPSLGLKFLRDSGLISIYPELASTIDCPQDPLYHPEGDVWVHTCLCLDMFKHFEPKKKEDAIVVGLATICHDLGKPLTTRTSETGRITSYMHDVEGVLPARTFLERIVHTESIIAKVLPLVRWHMTPYQLLKSNTNPEPAIRRLAARVGRLDLLVTLLNIDRNGRGQTEAQAVEDADFLLRQARKMDLEKKKPVPLLKGKHLVKRGMRPSKEFGTILEACFEAQLNGDFKDLKSAESYLDKYLRGYPKTVFPDDCPTSLA